MTLSSWLNLSGHQGLHTAEMGICLQGSLEMWVRLGRKCCLEDGFNGKEAVTRALRCLKSHPLPGSASPSFIMGQQSRWGTVAAETRAAQPPTRLGRKAGPGDIQGSPHCSAGPGPTGLSWQAGWNLKASSARKFGRYVASGEELGRAHIHTDRPKWL